MKSVLKIKLLLFILVSTFAGRKIDQPIGFEAYEKNEQLKEEIPKLKNNRFFLFPISGIILANFFLKKQIASYNNYLLRNSRAYNYISSVSLAFSLFFLGKNEYKIFTKSKEVTEYDESREDAKEDLNDNLEDEAVKFIDKYDESREDAKKDLNDNLEDEAVEFIDERVKLKNKSIE